MSSSDQSEPAEISEQLEIAITSFLRENPGIENEHGTDEARVLAARYLAKNSPESFDPSNSHDSLLAFLAQMEDGDETSP
ncbi:MAG: hypothetical protein IAE94_01760 [Chthoniobacterales bacterium]|nr:hypothetical protein [Chthoniobacterales bacterium]